ncbi:MAG: metallophosphoesterase [Clostridiales bacterium]|nr:metallophosphoesterase [Clostridiales bacterium]
MKLLVFSDSHRFLGNMEQVIKSIGHQMAGIIHLGDVCEDVAQMEQKFPNYRFYSVKGNNDWNCAVAEEQMVRIGGKKILLTHGHLQRVSFSPMNIFYWAQEKEADAVLFGHTHVPYCTDHGGVLLFNPGSISLPRAGIVPTFGILELSETGGIRGTVMEYIGPNLFRMLPSHKIQER